LALIYLFKINKKVIEKINELKKIIKELNKIKKLFCFPIYLDLKREVQGF